MCFADANSDGNVSPQEFLSFLQFFGPLDSCVDKVVRSILDFGTRCDLQISF